MKIEKHQLPSDAVEWIEEFVKAANDKRNDLITEQRVAAYMSTHGWFPIYVSQWPRDGEPKTRY